MLSVLCLQGLLFVLFRIQKPESTIPVHQSNNRWLVNLFGVFKPDPMQLKFDVSGNLRKVQPVAIYEWLLIWAWIKFLMSGRPVLSKWHEQSLAKIANLRFALRRFLCINAS